MTTLNRKNTLNPQLFILSAVLLLQAHSAFAGDPSNDAQAQVRAFLDPPVVHRVIAAEFSSETSANHQTRVVTDAQELARALLSGKSTTDAAVALPGAANAAQARAHSVSREDHRSYSDPQEAARRMILGLAAPAAARSVASASESPGQVAERSLSDPVRPSI
jgi:hypothetical protein